MYGMTHNATWFGCIVTGLAAVAMLCLPATAGSGGNATIISEGHKIEVRVDDGEISVTVDGKEIPTDRILSRNGRIVLLDEDGNEQPLFRILMGDDDQGFGFRFQRFGDFAAPRFDEVMGPRPKVMLGIHMAEPSKALQRHLNLEPGSTTMITGLYRDLAAHAAGLDEFDIIVAVDGETPADPAGVRDALAEKEVGDSIRLTVIHEGATRKVRVTLDAFDAERMREAELIGGGPRMRVFGGPVLRQIAPFNWRELLVDPDTSQFFRQWDWPGRDSLRGLEEVLRQRAPEALADRLEGLSDGIAELQEMLDQLIEQAQDAGRSARERGSR